MPVDDPSLAGCVLTDPALASGSDLLAEVRAMARDWRLGRSAFMAAEGVTSEADYKRRAMAEGRMMQHAHIGFRSIDRTVEAMGALHGRAGDRGVRIDRFGVTLDWTMGYPQAHRSDRARGTGIVLRGPEDFARITGASPAAAHFGDFMLGLPGALDNTCAAIAAGATAIGNLGQYFTFRLPYWDDDVATTEATLRALGLIAAQEAEILVHSNLDDGFAGLFLDMTSAFGMALIEKYIVQDLVGAPLSFCFGHHFSAPLTRAAFQAALARETDTPGTMIFGNTVAYQGGNAQNYASLANYLLVDLCALREHHSGHAINPVPVTENIRIPDVDEILDAQVFAARLADHAAGHAQVRDHALIGAMADRLIAGGRVFAENALKGLAERGVDTADPAALMLAIRRLGARRMEAMFGAGPLDGASRAPLVAADWAEELDEKAEAWVRRQDSAALAQRRVALGTTDVHEHGAYLVRRALIGLGAEVIEAGVAVDAEVMVACAVKAGADAIAVSTYNGIGLDYARRLTAELRARGADIPVLMGGKLNEIPLDSNSSLPVDVTTQIRDAGAYPCADLDDMLAALKP
ncbi:B12 binding domain-containing protein [Roseovarius nanhaiticus]|uniref:B12 binding domain-containing protein n=1 Tax=Roseovarius nanhaiticus TaxID=573024 RepID=A0A1N7G376_9RHOB|nr:cobalamin-dependent protein [Roseovarius nanhaiticus]SEK38818.1 B12 binding domain-containing protein [Roseovarius nanhaiticus]SIS06896.1 B12 binding domain-containing protein [Roseovarius nanhaiticus]